MDEQKRKVMYTVIIVICVISILVGLISEVGIGGGKIANNNRIETGNVIDTEQFDPNPDLFFDNMFSNNTKKDNINFDESKYKKMNSNEPLVWEFFSKDVSENTYSIKVKVPCINLTANQENGGNITSINNSIQKSFGDPINYILGGGYSENTIYNGDYAAFIYKDRLSIVLRSKLKVGNNTQDMMVKTYNINLSTLDNLNLEEELKARGYSVSDAEKKIKEYIRAKNKYAEDLKSSNLKPYERDEKNQIYKIENTTEFFITEAGDLYIVYSYGNSTTEETTEKDVIKFEAK